MLISINFQHHNKYERQIATILYYFKNHTHFYILFLYLAYTHLFRGYFLQELLKNRIFILYAAILVQLW